MGGRGGQGGGRGEGGTEEKWRKGEKCGEKVIEGGSSDEEEEGREGIIEASGEKSR